MKVASTDKNGVTKRIQRWMYDDVELVDWAAKHFDNDPDQRANRVNDDDEPRTKVFPDGLDLTKRQKRNLAALTTQWRCSSEDAIKRMLNVQGLSLGRVVNAIDTGEVIFLAVNDRGKEFLLRKARWLGKGVAVDTALIEMLRNTDLGPYLLQDSRKA
jgi:hypothetical protein